AKGGVDANRHVRCCPLCSSSKRRALYPLWLATPLAKGGGVEGQQATLLYPLTRGGHTEGKPPGGWYRWAALPTSCD
ncbi:hypothetical protein C7B79_30930, partial [Chroococcidiopsis cubana CCALA 043]